MKRSRTGTDKAVQSRRVCIYEFGFTRNADWMPIGWKCSSAYPRIFWSKGMQRCQSENTLAWKTCRENTLYICSLTTLEKVTSATHKEH